MTQPSNEIDEPDGVEERLELVPSPENSGLLSVTPVAEKTHIDPGENVKINIFIPGYGIPEISKLSISFSSQESMDSDEESYLKVTGPNVTIDNYDTLRTDNSFYQEVINTMSISSNKAELSSSHTTIKLPSEIFMYNPNAEKIGFFSLMSEAIHNHPEIDSPQGPIHLKFTTPSRNYWIVNPINSGEHTILFTLTYDINGTTYKDTSEIDIHINSFSETYSTTISIVGLFLSTAVVIFSVIQFIL